MTGFSFSTCFRWYGVSFSLSEGFLKSCDELSVSTTLVVCYVAFLPFFDYRALTNVLAGEMWYKKAQRPLGLWFFPHTSKTHEQEHIQTQVFKFIVNHIRILPSWPSY